MNASAPIRVYLRAFVQSTFPFSSMFRKKVNLFFLNLYVQNVNFSNFYQRITAKLMNNILYRVLNKLFK